MPDSCSEIVAVRELMRFGESEIELESWREREERERECVRV